MFVVNVMMYTCENWCVCVCVCVCVYIYTYIYIYIYIKVHKLNLKLWVAHAAFERTDHFFAIPSNVVTFRHVWSHRDEWSLKYVGYISILHVCNPSLVSVNMASVLSQLMGQWMDVQGLLIFLCVLLLVKYLRDVLTNNMPPGPFPLPLVGNVLNIGFSDPMEVFPKVRF